jgi:hypothetical protein
MPMTLLLATLYANADAIAALYTAFLALDLVLGLNAAASLDAAAGARPRHHHLP